MQALTYDIRLEQPNLAASLRGDPNSGVAFDYLPGSTLRGALIAKYLMSRGLKPDQLDPTDPDIRRLFFDGSMRYLNAYPCEQDRPRMMPTPRSWHRLKGEPEGGREHIYDFALPEQPIVERPPQRVTEPFCLAPGPEERENSDSDEPEIRLFTPLRDINVHTARTRSYGRAMSSAKTKINLAQGDKPGAVFRYDTLARRQVFRAVILFDDDNDIDKLEPLLNDTLRVGRSRNAEYGQLALQIVDSASDAAAWRELPDEPSTTVRDYKGRDYLTITLLSDAFLRDTNGQAAVSSEAMTDALAASLGKKLVLAQAFFSAEPLGGFNRKWGLPIQQALAVSMGSVFVYRAPEALSEQALADLEWQGIGERRVEGFGRVAANLYLGPDLLVDDSEPQPDRETIQLSAGSHAAGTAKTMLDRMLRQRFDTWVVADSGRPKLNNLPSNAQIGRLRNVIRNELISGSPEAATRIMAYLQETTNRASARKQFEQARVGDKTLARWIEVLLDMPQTREISKLRTLFGDEVIDAASRTIGGVGTELTDSLVREYVLRYIDAVLARAVKVRRNKEG